MKKYILDYVNALEGFKAACHNLHWDAKNLSQHKLCDEIMDSLGDFQDKISEVEQSISGRLPLNSLVGKKYDTTTLQQFIKDVISTTKSFYEKLQKEGSDYIGMRSDVEAFLSDLQRFSYLVDFTIKESLKERLRNKINENRIELSVGNTTFNMTENELRELVAEAIDNVKRKKIKEIKRTIRLSEVELKHIVSESVKMAVNEHVSMKHSGHNMDDFLDDNDFMEIVNRVVGMYDADDFDENDVDYIDNMEMEIADLINEFICDEALDEFGYKYGRTNYRRVASNVVRYIQTHLNELY